MTGLRIALLYDYGRRVDARGDGYLAVAVYAQSPASNASWVGHRGGSPYRYRFAGGRLEALGWLVLSLAELGYEKFRAVPRGES